MYVFPGRANYCLPTVGLIHIVGTKSWWPRLPGLHFLLMAAASLAVRKSPSGSCIPVAVVPPNSGSKRFAPYSTRQLVYSPVPNSRQRGTYASESLSCGRAESVHSMQTARFEPSSNMILGYQLLRVSVPEGAWALRSSYPPPQIVMVS